MKPRVPSVALGVPLCRRGLSTTCYRPRQLKKGAANRPTEVRSQPQASDLNAKLSARGRVDSVSSISSHWCTMRLIRVIQVRQGHDPKTRLRLDGSKKYSGRHALFRNTVLLRLQKVLAELANSEYSTVGINEDELNRQAVIFMNTVDESFMLAEQNVTQRERNPLFWNLRDAFIQKDTKGLTSELRYAFQSFLVRHRFSKGLEDSQQRLLDLRYPLEWYPATSNKLGKNIPRPESSGEVEKWGVCGPSASSGNRGVPTISSKGVFLRTIHRGRDSISRKHGQILHQLYGRNGAPEHAL
jgi:hypothetical protein